MRRRLLGGLAVALGAATMVVWTVGSRPEAAAPAVSTDLAASSTTATASSSSSSTAVNTKLTTSGTLPAVPTGYTVVEDNGTLRMAVDMQHCLPQPGCNYGNIQIVDERNGYAWYSAVPNPTTYAQNQHWQGVLGSDFLMGFTNEERTGGSNTPANTPYQPPYGSYGADLTVTQIPNGVSMTYTFNYYTPITMVANLVLSGNKLTVTIPWKDIKAPSCARYPKPQPLNSLTILYIPPECDELTKIDVLPSFGAQQPGTQGYLVLPDGSGALVKFAVNHPVYKIPYTAPIYGDQTVTPADDNWAPEASMPIFGMVNSQAQAGLLSVVSEGAADATINLIPASQQAFLYMAYAEFTYRPQYTALQEGLQKTQKYSWQAVPGDRQVTYYFLAGQQANYSGMAQQYRQYLINNQHAQPLKAQPKPPFLMQVLNGIREVGVLFDPFKAATTFSQTQQMLQSLQSQGVGPIRVSLEGWQQNGYNWKTLPTQWPPAGQLGGTAGLQALASYAKQHGDQLVLTMNMYEAFRSGNGFNINKDSLHYQSQLLLLNGNGSYLISPDVAAKSLFPPLLQDAGKVGIAGMDFDYLARNVYPNYEPQHTLSRSQSEQYLMGMVAQATSHLGTGGVQGGNLYAIGSANYFYNAPVTDSGFVYESQAVPFWEMAVHGLALYSGQESNLRSSPTQQRLQMIEDGALPVYELTWSPSTVLRYTNYNNLYSSQFSAWEKQAVSDYTQEQQSGYGALAYVAMVSNETIAPGVTETDYANGARVLVNFTSQPYASSYGVTVPAENYVVVGGGGTAQ